MDDGAAPGAVTVRPAAALAATLLLAPLVAAGEGDLRLERVFDGSAIGARSVLRGWSGKPLSLADVDRDGDLDLLAHDVNGHVYVIDPARGRAILELAPDHPRGDDIGPFNGVKAADLDGDGAVEIVSVDRRAYVTVWSVDASDGRLVASLLWERRPREHYEYPTADAGAALGDLDRDGRMDLVVQTEERGLYAFRHDGSDLWSSDEYGGNAEAWVGDADADGDLDVIAFTDGGVVHAREGATGALLWRFEARRHDVWPASIPARGLVRDLDGDGRVEVAFCARNVEDATVEKAPGAPYYRQHHFALFLVRDGTLLWMRKPDWGNPMCAADLMAHDVDGDGRMDIFGLDWNTIGHKPGSWERLGPAHAFSFDLDGRERWHKSLDTRNAKFTIAIADVAGDDRQEIVAYDDASLVLLDARDGRVLRRVGLDGRAVEQGPLVGDLLGDGRTRVVVAVKGGIALLDAGTGRAPPAHPGWSTPPTVAPLPPSPPTPEPTPMPSVSPPATTPSPGAPTIVKEAAAPPRPTPGAGAFLGALAIAAAAMCVRRR